MKSQELIEVLYQLETNFQAAAAVAQKRLEDQEMILLTALMISNSVRYELPLAESVVIDLNNARTKIDAILTHNAQCTAERDRRIAFRLTSTDSN